MTPFEISSSGGGLGLLATLAFLLGLAGTLFWMYVAWSAMRAHEELSASVRRLAVGSEPHDDLD